MALALHQRRAGVIPAGVMRAVAVAATTGEGADLVTTIQETAPPLADFLGGI